MTSRKAGYTAIALFALVALAGIALRPLVPIDETRYVSVAWEMHVTGDWLVPHKNGAIYTDKPPLLFWLINLAWAITGVAEWSARLIGPLFAGAMLAGTWALGRRIWGPAEGARAAAVLAGFSVFAIYGGATMFDTMLGAAVIAGIGCLWAALAQDGGRRAWVGLGLAIGFGVYAKGPVILVHLLPVLLAAPVWAPRFRAGPGWAGLRRGTGLALAVALGAVALWLVPAAIAGGEDYRRMILWEQSSGRMVSSFAHARPWYWLVATLPVLLFPWIWTPALWRGGAGRLDRRDPGLRLVAIWALSGLVLFSLISGKQVHYLVPELPAAALIIARALGPAADGVPAAWRGIALPAALAGLAGLAGLAAALGLIDAGSAAPLLRPALAVAAGVAVLGAAIAIGLRLPLALGNAALGLGAVAALDIVIGLTGIGGAYDAQRIGSIIKGHEADGIAVVLPRYHAEFNFPARLASPAAELSPADLPGWLAAHPQGRVVGLCGRTPLSAPATREIDFNGDRYCLWEAPTAP